MHPLIPRQVVPAARIARVPPPQVRDELLGLVAGGAAFHCAGEAKGRPRRLLGAGYDACFKLRLFDTIFYLTEVRENEYVRFLVAYIAQPSPRAGGNIDVFPRIFYKDVSLVWRAATHFVHTRAETWIGKGDVQTVVRDGEEFLFSAEQTTDLPLEIQSAVESCIAATPRIRYDLRALELVLRRAPRSRIEAYADFTEPRRDARSNRKNLVNGGRSITRFASPGDPRSLSFARGYEPDFARGVLEVDRSTSRLYGGKLRRFRILSANREVQYLFFTGPRHVWIIPPQATTTELSSYGVRTVDVVGDEDAFVPGYEYHFLDETCRPPVFVSQIPDGYAGAANGFDPSRADASAWNEQLPVVREFRRKVLGDARRKSRTVTGSWR